MNNIEIIKNIEDIWKEINDKYSNYSFRYEINKFVGIKFNEDDKYFMFFISYVDDNMLLSYRKFINDKSVFRINIDGLSINEVINIIDLIIVNLESNKPNLIEKELKKEYKEKNTNIQNQLDKYRIIFSRNRKCIINTDLDGLLSGIVLKHYLNWQIVGFSNCSGKIDDELWLIDNNINILDCVFIDLPVCVDEIESIDQHFVLYDQQSIKMHNFLQNKLNPNLLRKKVYCDENKEMHYTEKYPFGTVHFIIAILEHLGIIKDKLSIDKKCGNFELIDLIFRADRSVGNTNQYTNNCIDWADWLIDIGGENTNRMFSKLKKEYHKRLKLESAVENYIINNFKCQKDGECSKLFRNKQVNCIQSFLDYLSYCMNMETISINKIIPFGKLEGKRIEISKYPIKYISDLLISKELFSYAFVSNKVLSITNINN